MLSRRPLLRSLLAALGVGSGGYAAWARPPSLAGRKFGGSGSIGAETADPTEADVAVLKTALAADAGPLVGLRYPENGARTRHWAEIGSKSVELSGLSGSDPTGATDSYVAFQRGLAVATARRAELVLDGAFRISLDGRPPIVIRAPITIRGSQHRSSNVTSLPDHGAGLYFDQDVPAGILVDESQLTLDRCAIIGPARASRNPGIRTIGENAALRLCGGTVVQSWQTGIQYDNGYYHRINDACVMDCVTGLRVSADGDVPPIYNLVIHQLKLVAASVAGSTAMEIAGGSQVSISQSSFESFLGNGIMLRNSSIELMSSYFEGRGGTNVLVSGNAHINAIGNRAYLNRGANRWIGVDRNSASAAGIVSLGNQFVVPEDATRCDIYAPSNRDPMAVTNIGEDVILNRVVAGRAVRYVAADFFDGTGPAALHGSHNIRFPAGDPRQHAPIVTTPVAIAPARTAFHGSPAATTMLPHACSSAMDDPGRWRTSDWGPNPMMMVFHRSAGNPGGQWEKMGLRLPHIAPPANGGVIDAEARETLAKLLAALQAQAVMPPS